MGWPVAHSRSPAIHNAALQVAGLATWRYQLLPVAPELVADLVRALPGAGFRGVNVTIPHKQAALALATEPTPRARAIGAANTLTFEASGAVGADNTDAPALIEALPFPAGGLTALVLGAGGSARAAVWALHAAGAREVRVWNRTQERAERLCAELGGVPVASAAAADLIINCTSIGLAGETSLAALPIDPDDLARFGCVVDLVYTASGTELVRSAQRQGVPTVDGRELLVRQGALSFERFTGVSASLEVMRRALGLEASDYGEPR